MESFFSSRLWALCYGSYPSSTTYLPQIALWQRLLRGDEVRVCYFDIHSDSEIWKPLDSTGERDCNQWEHCFRLPCRDMKTLIKRRKSIRRITPNGIVLFISNATSCFFVLDKVLSTRLYLDPFLVDVQRVINAASYPLLGSLIDKIR